MSNGEIINLKTRIKTVFIGDEILYIPVDICDKCSDWKDIAFGSFQRGLENEKIMWFCGDCK